VGVVVVVVAAESDRCGDGVVVGVVVGADPVVPAEADRCWGEVAVVEGADPWSSEEAGEAGRGGESGVCGDDGEGERVDAAEGRCERDA